MNKQDPVGELTELAFARGKVEGRAVAYAEIVEMLHADQEELQGWYDKGVSGAWLGAIADLQDLIDRIEARAKEQGHD